jgi:hypothetical protein
VNPRRGFVRIPQLDAAGFLGHFGGASLEHQLESAHLLVGQRHEPARLLNRLLSSNQPMVGYFDMDLAPIQQTLHSMQLLNGELHAGGWPLCSIHLLQDGVDPRFGGVDLSQLVGRRAIALGVDLARLIEKPLALAEGNVERDVRM